MKVWHSGMPFLLLSLFFPPSLLPLCFSSPHLSLATQTTSHLAQGRLNIPHASLPTYTQEAASPLPPQPNAADILMAFTNVDIIFKSNLESIKSGFVFLLCPTSNGAVLDQLVRQRYSSAARRICLVYLAYMLKLMSESEENVFF